MPGAGLGRAFDDVVSISFLLVSDVARGLLASPRLQRGQGTQLGGRMDFAADAVLDVTAPPGRTAPARASTDAEAGPSFEEHLQAAASEIDLNLEGGAAASDHVEKQPAGDAGAPQLGATPPTPAPLATVVAMQLIASPRPAQQSPAATAETPPTHAAAPSLPMQPIADGENPPASPQAPATPGAPQAEHAKTGAAASAKATPAMDAAPATTTSPSNGPAPPQPPAAQQNAQTPMPSAPPAAASEAIDSVATAADPALVAPAAQHAASQPKATHAQADLKFETTTQPERGAPPAPAGNMPNVAAKAAMPQTAAKSATPSLAAEPVDAPQQSSSTSVTASTHASHTQQAGSEQSPVRAAPAAHQVAQEIVRRFDRGATRFELRLDPPELGRVEVRLDVSRDQRVTAVIAADNPQALTELARHARELEQMLQGAGLALSENGLSFDLRQNSESGEMESAPASLSGDQAPADEPAPIAARPLGYERWRGVRVDMMV